MPAFKNEPAMISIFVLEGCYGGLKARMLCRPRSDRLDFGCETFFAVARIGHRRLLGRVLRSGLRTERVCG